MSSELPCFREILLRDAGFAGAVAELHRGRSISVNGVQGSSCALAAAAIAQTATSPLLVVVPEDIDCVADDLRLFAETEILAFPHLADTPTNSGVFALVDDLFGQRIRVLKSLSTGVPAKCIVVASIAALLQPVPSRQLLDERTQTLSVGAVVPLETLRKFLVDGGYHATSAVELPGEFAARGYILDIFAPDWERPVRIEFFGDEIESLRRFDIDEGKGTGKRTTLRTSERETTVLPRRYRDWLRRFSELQALSCCPAVLRHPVFRLPVPCLALAWRRGSGTEPATSGLCQ